MYLPDGEIALGFSEDSHIAIAFQSAGKSFGVVSSVIYIKIPAKSMDHPLRHRQQLTLLFHGSLVFPVSML
jgi:hypothetical protein